MKRAFLAAMAAVLVGTQFWFGYQAGRAGALKEWQPKFEAVQREADDATNDVNSFQAEEQLTFAAGVAIGGGVQIQGAL